MKLTIPQNKYKITIALLAIFSVFVCLSCISAADDVALSDNGVTADGQIPCFPVCVTYTDGTGYHWEISPETHGATLMTVDKVADNPGCLGSSGTMYYNFFIPDNGDFFIKLVEYDPAGNVVDTAEVSA